MKDINSKREIIENIKKEWLGDGSGNQKALEKAHSRLTDTTNLLSDELYVNDLHFLMELIQNADDNTYSKDEIPTLEIELQEDKLLFICNEKGFTEKDVSAICDVNQSGKISDESERRGYIGEKGIGFKSVFKVCDIPEIYSNGFQFRLFGNNTNQHTLKYVVPEWIDKPTMDINPKKTTLVLPLKEIYQKGGEKESDLSKEFSEIEPNILLFLRKIKKLIIVDKTNNQRIEILKTVDNDIVTLTIKKKDEPKPLEQKYLIINHIDRPAPKGLKETRAKEKRAGIKFSDITLGFPLTASNKPKIVESNKVYTFLPVKDYGLNFLINADFLLTSAREDIIDNDWNRWLRNEVFEAFKIAIKKFKKDTNFKYYFLKYLSDPENINNAFFKKLSTDVFNYCKQEPVFPTIRNKWTTIDNIIGYDVKDVQFINKETLEQEVTIYFMSKEAHRNYKGKVCNLFEIQPIKLEQIAKCLDNPEWIEKYNHKKLLKFYQYLQEKFRRNYSLLGNKKIIKLKDENFKSAKDNPIFLKIPTKGKRRYSFENRLNIVHSDFIKEVNSLQRFFVNIGVKKATAETIILEYILPQFNQDLRKTTIVSFTEYIKEHIDSFGKYEIEKIRREIKIITKSDNIANIKKHETFFPNSYKPQYDMEFFLKGLWENIFVSDEYLKNSEPVTEWITFFKKLGVYEFPIPYSKPKGNSDIVSCWQIEQVINDRDNRKYLLLLEMLANEWNTFGDFVKNTYYTNYYRSRVDYYFNSYWLKSLERIEIFNINNKWYKPSEVYYLSSKITELFEGKLPILNPETYSNKSFLEVIGVKFKVESNEYIKLLKEYKKHGETEISDIKEIYKQLHLNSNSDSVINYKADKIRREFETASLIYRNGEWLKPSKVIWKTPPNVFKDDYTPLASIYKSQTLKSFFVEKLDIKEEIKIDDSHNLLLEFEGKKIDRESRNIIEKLYATINFNNIEIEEERTEKIKTLKDSKLWLNQSNQLCNSDEVYFVEDRSLYKEFKGEAIYLYRISNSNKGHITSVKRFLKQLDIYQPFENALSLKIENFTEQSFSEKWKRKLKKAIRIAIEYINSKEDPKIIEELSKNKSFKILSDANIVILDELQATYSINEISKSKTIDSLFDISKNIIFIKQLDDETTQSLLAEEIGKYLEIDGLDDFIDRVLAKSSKRRIYRKKNIQLLNDEELAQIILGRKTFVSINEIQNLLGIEETEEEVQEDKIPKVKKPIKAKSNHDNIPVTTSNPKPEVESNFIDDEEEFDEIDIEEDFDILPFAVSIETKNYDKKDDSYSKAVKPTFKGAKRSTSNYSNYRKHKPETTGDWGEFAVFLSLVDELKEKYNSLSDYEESENLFIIKDKKGNVIVKLELLNQNGNEAASRDMELTENNTTVLIEVKSTTDDYLSNFKVSNSQWRAMKKEQDNYWIYRVFGVGKRNCRIEKIENPYQQIIDGTIQITSNLDLGL